MAADLESVSVFDGLIREVRAGARAITLSGLTTTSAKAYLLASLVVSTGHRFAVISGSNDELDAWETDLSFWLAYFRTQDGVGPIASPDEIIAIPGFETDPYSGVSPHAQTLERRALAFWKMSSLRPTVAIASMRAVIGRTVGKDRVSSLGNLLHQGQDTSLEDLIENLEATGYVREDPIYNLGQFSVRGGILDVWSPDTDTPFRVEFFGDTVDSIRSFDPETQLSTGHLASASIAPMREFHVSDRDLIEWTAKAREHFSDESFSRALKDRTDFAEHGETFAGWEFLLPLARPLDGSFFEYLDGMILVVDEPSVIERSVEGLLDEMARRSAYLSEHGELCLAPDELFLTSKELRERFGSHSRIELRALGKTASQKDEEFAIGDGQTLDGAGPLFLFPTAGSSAEFELVSRPTMNFRGDISKFISSIDAPGRRPFRTDLFVAYTPGMAERLAEIFREYQIDLDPKNIRVGSLSGGFEIPTDAFAVWTERDIFGDTDLSTRAAPAARPQRSRLGVFISDFRDLKPGDFVVHVDHGIGRFEGLQAISAQGVEREFMLLVYADDAKLFVPVERLDLVSRYGSGETASPSLDRLGGIGWQKTKARAKRAMRDMADELLRLYAERKLVAGHAFSADAPWQHEFEDAFPYELTEDQAKAIEDVKSDMETPRPMDRLIIGDVGYGKTEVAMRAAFKAVMDGRQVAVLAPTTILAYQHFETFSRRFAAFPAKVDLLSRFRGRKEQKAVVETAAKGDLDVLVGTHRILSNDVSLPKLGLVVVDEEQRFGVAHKERLKQLKKKVDVLTLSATPIPRTLNMSLLGMRDMSVIETPPRDRLAINTQVVQFSESVIRSAIDLELARNGQVFFIHNRVETIESIAALIQKIVPNARIAIGHGQINEKEMEQIMLDFIDYKYDVLVATTIIENGIDIPRANTIIINRSDNYGLSQLYQLRGRVGRSNRRAYAYLLIPGELELTPIARRRLSAIREFSDLGAGFRIAALDLELRGAGSILGGQQSGHLEALGFDLYTRMLERTIAELRGDEIADESGVAIELGIDVSIPREYIIDSGQRLRTYKRISSAGDDQELGHIRSELEDRYGRMPGSVVALLEFARLRRLAEAMGLVSIDRSGATAAAKLAETSRVSPDKLLAIVSAGDRISFSPNGILRFPVDAEDVIASIRAVLEKIRS